MAIHMAVVLNDAADIAAEEAAKKRVIFQSTVRYAVVADFIFPGGIFQTGECDYIIYRRNGVEGGSLFTASYT